MRTAIAILFLFIASGCVQKPVTETTLPITSFPEGTRTPTGVPSPPPEPKAFDYYEFEPSGKEVSHPVVTEFPIVKSPMPYYVYNESAINGYKYNLTLRNIRAAFDKWENATRGRVKFVQVQDMPDNGVIIRIVTNLSGDTIGEASPSWMILGNYSLITGGSMELEPVYGGSENLVLITHEIGHIMGLGHDDNSHSVLYPWNAYSQVITPEIIEALDILYEGVPVAS